MKGFLVLTTVFVSVVVSLSNSILTISLSKLCYDVLKDTKLHSELESRFKEHGMKIEFVLSDDPLESIGDEASAAILCGDAPDGLNVIASIPFAAMKLACLGDERPDFLGTTTDMVKKAKYIFPKSTVVVFTDLRAAIEALREGDVDAVFQLECSFLKLGVPKDQLHGIDRVKGFLRFVFPADSDLLKKINSVILEMYTDGTHEKLVKGVDGIERSNVLRLAVIERPPYEFLDRGEWSGTDVEIVKTVLKKLGYDAELGYYPPVRAFRMLESGVLDGAFSLEKTPERERFLDYVDVPVSSGFDVFFVLRKPDLDWNFPPELVEESLCGYVKGYVDLNALERFCSRIITIPNDELGMMLLGKGRIGAFMTNYFVGSFFARKLGIIDKVVASSAVRHYNFYLALSKSSPHKPLVDFLEKELEEFKSSLEYHEILREYGVESNWGGR